MKKFTVIGLVVAAVMAGVGLLLCGISSMTGGYRTAKEFMADEDGIVSGNWHITRNGIWYGDDLEDLDKLDDLDGLDKLEDLDDLDDLDKLDDLDDLEDLEDWEDTIVDKAVKEEELFAVSEIRELEFDIGAAEIIVKENADAEHVSVQLVRGKEKYYNTEFKDGKLLVEYGKNQRNVRLNGNYPIVRILIPAGAAFDEIDMNVGACDAKFDVSDVSCRELNISLGAGVMRVNGFTVADETDIEVGAGELIIEGGEYGDMDMECGVGNLEMSGTVNRNLTVECGMGNVALWLTGAEEEYNYTMECSMGNLEVNGHTYSGFGRSETVKNPGAKGDIDLECSMGNLELHFR